MLQVLTETWEARRARTEILEQRHPFAAELLRLFAALLPIQEEAFLDARTAPPAPGRIAAHVAERVVPRIVDATTGAGPERLAEEIADCLDKSSAQAIVAGWMFGDEQAPAERYLARAALSPVLEALGPDAAPAFHSRRDPRHCPRCGGPPQLSCFKLAADDLASGGRVLVCARCHAEWGYPRMTCAGCGEKSGSRLPVYSELGTAAGERGGVVRGLGIPGKTDALFPHIRIEACETCRRYMLNIDLAADAQAVPLVDELSALPLDLYAREIGFTKITPNLMGF
ncbi:MAG: formate dehydrogenase accessory protein FdhE [Chloroflexi bacterium]|nr:MAG: formate dehydrogenase accessory protein FdhE [Chloroflexota bacterium]